MDNLPGPSGNRVREWENVVLAGEPGDVCHDRVQT